MKKYIRIPDFTENGTNHFFEVPSDFFVHAKACTDGIAIVIGDKTTDTYYGYTISAAEENLPVIKYLVMHEDTALVEDMISDMLSARIALFLADRNETVFNIIEHHDDLFGELNYILEGSALPEMFEQEKQKAKKNRKQKTIQK